MTTAVDAPAPPERVNPPETAQETPGGPAAPTPDTDAPYGRTATGAARRKPGRKTSARTSPTPPPAPRRRAGQRTSKAPSREAEAGRYAEGCQRLLRTLVAPLMVLGQRNAPVAADAATLAQAAPALSDAVGQLAVEEARVAAALDRLMAVGPYGEVGTILLSVVAQLAYNHGAIPPPVGAGMGLQDPAVLAAGVRRQSENVVREAERKAANSRGV